MRRGARRRVGPRLRARDFAAALAPAALRATLRRGIVAATSVKVHRISLPMLIDDAGARIFISEQNGEVRIYFHLNLRPRRCALYKSSHESTTLPQGGARGSADTPHLGP